ncbi:MAG: response regulator transcription factor [Sedimentisphaerales bacterium]|nr:response regulator transcription factor [Sedimentisphaerales bacterium]
MARQNALHVDYKHQRQIHICRNLASLGFEVHKAPTVKAAAKLVRKHFFRLILIRCDSADEAIFNFYSFVRSGSSHTILIALMHDIRINLDQQLFECGADDVAVGQQTSAVVLTKRIKAHLRNGALPLWLKKSGTIRLKESIVDFERREVWCNGSTRTLPGILVDLLRYFLDNPDRVISREELRKSPIWADSICSSVADGGKTFDVHIGRLRKIIEARPSEPQIIKSVRGIGWKLARDCVS